MDRVNCSVRSSVFSARAQVDALGSGSGRGRNEVRCAPVRKGRRVSNPFRRGIRSLHVAVLSVAEPKFSNLSPERTSEDWMETGFPTYLRSKVFNGDPFCNPSTEDTPWKEYMPYSEGDVNFLFAPKTGEDIIWSRIREGAKEDADFEPLLSSFLYCSVLSHKSFEMALAFVLAQKLASNTLLATHLIEIFERVLMENKHIRISARADVLAAKCRDPACLTYGQPLLFYKGYQAIQAYRISNALWRNGQKVLALALQTRMSEVFSIDIHPAATIGMGILLDHGTGVVIGETAVIGDRVSIMQGVTLGGTGKHDKDRHPKIGEGVLIGANSTVLGNIKIGKGSMVAAGSLVLKPVRPYTMVAGSPAKEVGRTDIGGTIGLPAITMKQQVVRTFCEEWEAAVGQALGKDSSQLSSQESSQQPPAPRK